LAIACGVLLLLAPPVALNAQFGYTTTNGTITITGYTGPGGTVYIPGSINGLPVTSIGYRAFYGCTNLTSVTIPGSAPYIGRLAFMGCTSLTGVFFEGNVLSFSHDAFGLDLYATVYYLPGAAGWGPTFEGLPTALWNPLLHADGPGLGVQPEGLWLEVTGTTNIPVVVEACADLSSAVWVALQTNTLAGGSLDFLDPGWTNHAARFYRVKSP